jgi:hypothetical protein
MPVPQAVASVDAKTRRRLLVAGVLAVVVGGLLMLFERRDAKARAPSSTRVPYRESQPGVGTGGPAAKNVPIESVPTPVPPGTGRRIRIRVVDEKSGRGIPGAALRFVRRALSSRAAGVVLRDETVRALVTDGSGSCVTELDRNLFDTVLAEAEGYARNVVGLPDSDVVDPLTIALPRELLIGGVAVDGAGHGVPGVEIRAHHVEAPRRWPDRAVAVGAHSMARARTGGRGEFRLRGLVPGTYRLALRADGWVVNHPIRRRAGRAALQIRRDLLVEAGTERVCIELDAVRAFRIRCLHGKTDVPASSTIVRVSVYGNDDVRATAFQSATPAPVVLHPPKSDASVRVLARTAPPGEVVAYATMMPARPPPERAKVLVDCRGYQTAFTSATLRLPSELLADDVADEIRLEPEVAHETGRLVIDCSRAATGVWRPPLRYLTAKRKEGGYTRYLRGKRRDEDRWEFGCVPAGELTLSVHDGISTSEMFEAVLPPGGSVEVTARWTEGSALTFRLEDESGARLYGAEVVSVTHRGRAITGALADLTSLRLGPGGALRSIRLIAPGSYEYFVSKTGFRPARGTFEVEPLETAVVEVVLPRLP